MKKSILTIFELVTLLALFGAPLTLLLVDHSLLFPWITSKNFPWRMLIELAFVGWATLALLDVRYRLDWRNPLFLAFSLFMLAMLLATILGPDPFRSFWSNAERMEGYLGLLHLYAFFIAGLGFFQVQERQEKNIIPTLTWAVLALTTTALIYSPVFAPLVGEAAGLVLALTVLVMGLVMWPTLERPLLIKTFLHGLLALGVMLGVMALFQDKARVDSVLGNPIYLASFANLALFISGYFLLGQNKLFAKVGVRELLYGSLILFFLYIIFQTATRGAILGLVCGGLTTATLLALLARDKEDIWWRRLSLVGITLIITLTGTFFLSKDALVANEHIPEGSLLKRAAEFSLEDLSTKHRLANWEMALEGWRERPLTGWGQENYIHVFSKYYQADKLYDGEEWFDRTHNLFLDWLVFGGILGLGSFLGLLGTMLWLIWQKTSPLPLRQKSLLTGLLVAYSAQNFVVFDSLATSIWITTIIIMIALLYPQAPAGKNEIRNGVAVPAIICLHLSALIWMSHSLWEPKQSMYAFMSLISTPQAGESRTVFLEERFELLEELMREENAFTQEYLELLLLYHRNFIHPEVSPELRQQYAQAIAERTEEVLADQPYLTRLMVFYARFLQSTGNYEQAQVYLEQALAGSPQKIHILHSLAENAFLQGDSAEATEYLEQALALAPKYEAALTSLERIQGGLRGE